MNTHVDAALPQTVRLELKKVSPLEPFVWLARGIDDLVQCWPVNAAHGLLMVLLGWVLLALLGRHPYFVAAAVTGFLLVAPIMTTPLCELSRRREEAESLDFDSSLAPLARVGVPLLKFGIVLALFAVTWFVMSEAMLRELFDVSLPVVADTYYRGFLDTANRPQVIAYVATGAVLAAIVFALSVVTVPLIIDRHLRASQSIQTSLAVVARNPAAMVVWSALIAAIVIVGFASLLFGMIALIPMLGHASWHAYRDLVE
jgi:uncharacterized membrane protein